MALLIFIGIYHLFTYNGLDFFDDLDYATYAYQLVNGEFAFTENIFSHRIGLFLPTAVAYFLFGVNDITTAATAIVASVGTLIAIYCALKENKSIAIVACYLLGLSYYFTVFFVKNYPDVVITFVGIVSVMLIWKVPSSLKAQVGAAILFAGVVIWGVLSKETILYFFPFYFMLLVHDVIKRQHMWFWIMAAISGLIFLAGYLYMYYFFTGDPFYRITAIEDGHYAATYSYFDKPFTALIPRLTYQPWYMFLGSEVAILMILSIPVFSKLPWSNLRDTSTYFAILSIVLLLMFVFFTTSFRYYNPIGLFPRMYLMALPYWAILAALGLEQLFLNRRVAILYCILFVVCTLVTFYTGNSNQSVIYLLLSVVFLMIILLNNYKLITRNTIKLGLLLVLLIHPVYSMTKGGYANREEAYAVKTFLNSEEGKHIVVCDPRLYHGYTYYYSLQPKSNFIYIKYQDVPKTVDIEADDVYVLVNKFTESKFASINKKFPGFTRVKPGWEIIFQSKDIILYRTSSLKDLLIYY
ncbi:MAG TPA: hypothetical protein VIK89_09305 [Cytophagaceae bacterium]